MTCQDSFHEVAFNISFWTRNISSARILFWRGVCDLNIDVNHNVYSKNCSLLYFGRFLAENIFSINLKVHFPIWHVGH